MLACSNDILGVVITGREWRERLHMLRSCHALFSLVKAPGHDSGSTSFELGLSGARVFT